MAAKTALQWFWFAVSTAYQVQQYNKMKREADKRKGFAINKRGEATHIPVVYGKQALGLIEANHKTSNSFTYAAPGTGGTEWFSKNTFLNQSRSTNKNSTLIMNGAICQGGIEGVQGFSVDDSMYNRDKKHRHIVHTYNDQLTATAPLGNANGFGANQKFTGLAHATAAFHLNRDDYNYNGIPSLTFFVKGRKVRPVTESGGVYSLGGYIYSNNPAWCLLDYLLGDHGRNIDVSEIDLESFYNAGTICNTIKMTGAVVAGSVNGSYPIEAYNTFNDFPDVTSDDTNEDTYYKALDTGNFYTFTQTGTEENPNGSYSSPVSLPTRNIPLYECNIVLDSEATVRDNIESILNTMPLSVLTWTSDGKYKLQLEYPANQTALEALTVKTLNNDNVIRDSIDLQWSSASDRFNSVTVTFLNEHENFKEDSKTWPDRSTTAGDTLYNSLLSQDNNQPMSTDIRLEGVTDPYHALAHAEQIGRQSRTAHTISFIATKDAIGLEPGDFIKVELPLSDVDAVYRVNSTEISEDLTIKVDAFYIDINSYAWNVADNDDPGSETTNPTTFDPDLISNLTWSTTALYNGVASGNLSWTAAGSDILYYIVQASNDNQTTWFDLGTTTGTSFDVTALEQDTYHWGVRTVAPNGQLSNRVVIGPYNVTYTGPRTQDYIYATTSEQDTNTQSYDDTLSEDTYPYVAVIDYKPDEQPTLPVRSSSGTTLNFIPRTATLNRQLLVYKRSTTALTSADTPTGGSYDFTTSTLTPPSGWSNSITVGIGPVYVSNAQVEGLSGTTSATPSTWSTPAILGQDGQDAGVLIVYADDSSGTNATTSYTDEEYVLYYEYTGDEPTVSEILTEGTSTWVKFKGENGLTGASTNIIFQRAASQPNPPSDSSGVPTNWYDDASNTVGTGILWASSGTKAVDSTNFTWGTPFQVEGEAVAEVSAYRLNSNAGASGGSFNFTTNTLTPPTSWSLNPPSLSTDGDVVYRISGLATGSSVETSASISWGSAVIYANRTDGTTGQGIYPIYSSVQVPTSSSQLSFSPTNKDYVTFYESTTQPSLTDSALLSQTYIKYKGEDGDPAKGYVTTRAYIEASSAPSTGPDATITWSTLAVALDSTDAANGWTLTQPTIDADSTTDYYFSDISFVDATGIASSTTATGSNPTKQINFDGVVSFTDLSTENASTTIHGSNITTGTIDASQVSVTNLRADNISVGTGTINAGVIPTLAQSKISNLTTDISNINTNVGTAQTTANTAASDAATAQTTANTANTAASTAQTTANTAVSDAATAQSTANTAASNASTALSTANTASSTASTAYSTAIGKIKSYYASTPPYTSGGVTGDIWFNSNTNTSASPYPGQKNYYWNGSSWNQVALEADSVVANWIYAGTVNASNINAGTIAVDYLPGLTFADVVTGGDAGTSTSRFNTQSTANSTAAIRSALGFSSQTMYRYNNYASLSNIVAGSTLIGTATLTIEKNAGSQPSGMNTCYFVLYDGSTVVTSPCTNTGQTGSVTLESTNYTATFTAALAIESSASGTATMGFYFSGGSPDEDEMSADRYSFSVIEFVK